MTKKDQIKKLVYEYYAEEFPPKTFERGISHVPVSGKVIDAEDIFGIVESALDGWFTTGRFNDKFEKELAKYMRLQQAIMELNNKLNASSRPGFS